MNKPIYCFLTSAVLLLISINTTYAQLSRTERTTLQQEVKAYKRNLEAFKQFKEDRVMAEAKLNKAQTDLVNKRAELQTLNQELSKKDDAIESLQEALRRVRSEMGEVNAARQGRGGVDCEFSVQIGAYENRDLTQYMDNHPNFAVEQSNGLKKYTLGYFTSYWEAKSFSKYLDKSGAQTYVVGYFKGERVPDLKDMTQCTF